MHANSYFLRATRTNFKQFDIVDEYDDLDTYNGNIVYGMWEDFDDYGNTGTPNVLIAPTSTLVLTTLTTGINAKIQIYR